MLPNALYQASSAVLEWLDVWVLHIVHMQSSMIGPVLMAKKENKKLQCDKSKALSLHSRRWLQLWEQLYVCDDDLLWKLHGQPFMEEVIRQFIVAIILKRKC